MTAKQDFLMEIGCEEIPSRFLPGAMKQLEQGAADLLKENRLEYGAIETYATPRRLVVLIKALSCEQADLVEKVKGPPVDRAYDEQGEPTKALHGFVKNQGISIDQIEEEVIKNARYVIVRKEIPGRLTAELLNELMPQLIRKLSFPRPMYWESKDVRFARPIRWILALYDQTIIRFKYAGLEADNITYGHRFLAPGPFEIKKVEEYFSCLQDKYIILDHNRRREIILEQLKEKAEENGGTALVDDDLLEEVIYLVEYPVAIDGSFDEAYLDLPQEVPITSMQNHQRYFPIVEKDSGRLLPHFIGISNNLFHPNIRKGYAKVLQARLADGRFFFNEDRKEPLEKYVDQLKSVVFLESLGTLDQKRARLIDLAGKLGHELELSAENIEKTRRIAHLCKADLVTSMVKEFTELQGVMGREYARLSDEPEEVALGIYEHYLPRYPGDDLPSYTEAALVSLADRIDTLAGCFATGIQPTGSQDPYGLRRQAQGAVNILLNLEINIALKRYINLALEVLSGELKLEAEKCREIECSLHDFLLQRIRFSFQEREIAHEVVEAVLTVPFNNAAELFKRAEVLDDQKQGPLLNDVIAAYNRVANLAENAPGGEPEPSILTERAEKNLYEKWQETLTRFENANTTMEKLTVLQNLKNPIDNFFDDVMVMVDDEKLRLNRLNLVAGVTQLFHQVANFSKIQAP